METNTTTRTESASTIRLAISKATCIFSSPPPRSHRQAPQLINSDWPARRITPGSSGLHRVQIDAVSYSSTAFERRHFFFTEITPNEKHRAPLIALAHNKYRYNQGGHKMDRTSDKSPHPRRNRIHTIRTKQ